MKEKTDNLKKWVDNSFNKFKNFVLVLSGVLMLSKQAQSQTDYSGPLQENFEIKKIVLGSSPTSHLTKDSKSVNFDDIFEKLNLEKEKKQRDEYQLKVERQKQKILDFRDPLDRARDSAEVVNFFRNKYYQKEFNEFEKIWKEKLGDEWWEFNLELVLRAKEEIFDNFWMNEETKALVFEVLVYKIFQKFPNNDRWDFLYWLFTEDEKIKDKVFTIYGKINDDLNDYLYEKDW